MAALNAAVTWLVDQLLSPDEKSRPMAEEFHILLQRPDLKMAAALWSVDPEGLAVKVLKRAGRKVPRDWLDVDKPSGRFETRERLLDTVWMMVSGHRMVPEIARNVELPNAAVKSILESGEGRPRDLMLTPHPRRRGQVST